MTSNHFMAIDTWFNSLDSVLADSTDNRAVSRTESKCKPTETADSDRREPFGSTPIHSTSRSRKSPPMRSSPFDSIPRNDDIMKTRSRRPRPPSGITMSTRSPLRMPISSRAQPAASNSTDSPNAISRVPRSTTDGQANDIGDWFSSLNTVPRTESANRPLTRTNTNESLRGYALMARSSKKEFRWKKMEHVTPLILRRILNSNAVSNAVDDWSPFALSNFLQHPTKRQILRDFIRFNKAQSAELSEDSSSDSDSDGDSDDSSMMLKTAQDRHIVRSFPTLLAHKQKKAFSKRRQLRLAMNLYQKQSRDDIVEMNHFEKKQGKWKVLGLVDPNKHLSTLDHSLNLKSWASPRLGLSPKMDIVNYHHWIPSVFRSNAEGTDCQLLFEIPNLDPYRYGDTVYPLITDLFLHQLPQFENVLGLDLRNRALKVVVVVSFTAR